MGYVIILCLGFFGGFFLGFGLSGPYPAETVPMVQSLPAVPAAPAKKIEQREQELLRQLASAQASCARPTAPEIENPEIDMMNRQPASVPSEAEMGEYMHYMEEPGWNETIDNDWQYMPDEQEAR